MTRRRTDRIRDQRFALAVGISCLSSLCMIAAPRAQPPQPKPIVELTPSVEWADISTKAIKGRPARLAWADDRATLYLQTAQGETPQTLSFHHYLLRKDAAPAPLDAQPKWVESYWKWKAAKIFAGDPSLTIEVDTTKEALDNLNGTAANRAVYLTDSPIGLTGQDLLLAKQSGGTRIVNRLMLKGHIVGEFIDQMIVPGYTFSWSPEDLRLIAYRGQSGHLTIMDDGGRTDTVADTKDVLLPAWSDDGAAIAYLQRTKGHYSLRVLEVVGR